MFFNYYSTGGGRIEEIKWGRDSSHSRALRQIFKILIRGHECTSNSVLTLIIGITIHMQILFSLFFETLIKAISQKSREKM